MRDPPPTFTSPSLEIVSTPTILLKPNFHNFLRKLTLSICVKLKQTNFSNAFVVPEKISAVPELFPEKRTLI